MSDRTVVLVGTLDTKGEQYAYLRDRLQLHGVGTLLVDVGTLEPPSVEPDIDRHTVAAAAGVDLDIDGLLRANLEETGMGYGLEVEMIRLARERGVLSAPYVFDIASAE